MLVGTFTPDMLLPSTACLVQEKLGLRAPAMDLQAACASFVYAMITGMQFVATGCSRLALVIGADCNSRVVNPADKKTYPLFGDAAGAVLLAPGGRDQGLLSYAVGSDGSGADLLCRRMGGSRMPYAPDGAADGLHYLTMEGRPIFKWAIRMLGETITEVLDDAGVTLDDVDLVIFHQANMRIIARPSRRWASTRPRSSTTWIATATRRPAASRWPSTRPIAKGRIQPGDLILFSGFGAGLAWGTVLMRW